MRDVRWSVELWSSWSQTKRRSLDEYCARVSRSYVEKKEGRKQRARCQPAASPGWPSAKSDWAQRIHALEEGGAPAGGRFEALRDLSFHYVVVCSLGAAESASRMEQWIDDAPHYSRDFTGPKAAKEKVAAKRSMKQRIALLRKQVEAGELIRPSSWRPTTTTPCLSTLVEREEWGRNWRAWLLEELTPSDWTRCEEATSCRWLQRALGVLLSLLRGIQDARPDVREVAIPREVLQTIAGGGTVNFEGRDSPRYIVLRDTAQRRGILGPVTRKWSKKAKQATCFAMPPSFFT